MPFLMQSKAMETVFLFLFPVIFIHPHLAFVNSIKVAKIEVFDPQLRPTLSIQCNGGGRKQKAGDGLIERRIRFCNQQVSQQE